MRQDLARPIRFGLWLLMLAGLIACSGEDTLKPGADDPRYTIRGRVEKIQGQVPSRLVTIHHESIDDFKDVNGSPAAMESMTMDFGVAEGAEFSASVGALVEFEFAVRWGKEPMLLLTRATELPPETKLNL